MDQSEHPETEATAAGFPPPPQASDVQEVHGDPARTDALDPTPAAQPVKAPRKRRTASAPAGAPPAVELNDPTPASDAASGSGEGTPVRKTAARSRKAVATEKTAVTDAVTSAVGSGTPLTDSPSEAAASPAGVPEVLPTVRAPRTRRRAATAEAGPAAPLDAPAGPVVPEVSAVTASEAGRSSEADPTEATEGAAPPANDGPDAEAPVEAASVASARAPRSRRRAASAEAGPATTVEQGSGRSAASSTRSSASSPDVTDTAEAAAAADDEPVEENSVRTRRAGGGRSRSRRASEPTQPGTGPRGSEAAEAEKPAAASDTKDAGADTPAVPGRSIEEPSSEESADENRFDPFAVPESPLSLLFHAPDLTTVTVPSVKVSQPAVESEDDDESEDQGRRSRRSRRGRNRTRADGSDSADRTDAGSSADGDAGDTGDTGDAGDHRGANRSGPDDGPGVTSRRRRRRRRGDQDLELTGGEDDDPPNTVTRVRAPRQAAEPVSDQVTSVRGSTRLEAKKQRRRDSRDTGRRRQVITEAEFLARRESVDRQMIVRQRDDRIQIGVLEDGMLGEHFVSRTQQDSLIGNVYLGKVQNVLPSMEAAFVDIGRGRNAVLYAGEVNWDASRLDGQPRRIELALKSGDPVLVQVTKDPVGHKGARLTSQISLPGRYLVYVPGGSMTGISRKLPDTERNRLKRILKDRLPENAGVIVRTAAEGASEEELTHDINRLRSQWEEIERKAGSTKTLAPELLYGEPDLTIKVVRDVFNEDFSKLVVSGEEAWDTIEAYVMYVAPDLVGRLEKWTSEEDIFAASRIDEQIAKALERKVFLPSGGSLVIDRTEAMTVVDVNTGKFTGSGGNLEETVTKNNLEAAEEVVRQLRLRDIGGIIVIDFIDMVLEANRDLVLRRLVECLGRDRTKHQVAEVTSLGLVQMTRKRMGTGLLEVFGEDCEHCAGRGVVTYMEPVEHRHATAPEPQQQPRQDRPSRSERKRSRGRGGQQEEGFVSAPVVAPIIDSPDRAAKAEAARAALASIAAATHHAQEEHAQQGRVPEETASGTAADADIRVTEAVLTINGETVTLPRADGRRADDEVSEPAPTTRLTLDSLSEAFNRRPGSGPDAVRPTDDVAAPQPAAAETVIGSAVRPDEERSIAPAAPPVRRPRRRVARSAQGAADTTIETSGSDVVEPPSGTRHTVIARPAPARTESSAQPLIFGVGVPASEL